MKHIITKQVFENSKAKEQEMFRRDRRNDDVIILGKLVEEINRVKGLLTGELAGPLKQDYLDLMKDFYSKLESLGFDHKEETRQNYLEA